MVVLRLLKDTAVIVLLLLTERVFLQDESQIPIEGNPPFSESEKDDELIDTRTVIVEETFETHSIRAATKRCLRCQEKNYTKECVVKLSNLSVLY